MTVFTPELQLSTLFVTNDRGRITATREPYPEPGPGFALIRSATSCAWAIRADVSEEVAQDLERMARQEPLSSYLHEPPAYADSYASLLRGEIEFGPAFTFPDAVPGPASVVAVDDVRLLERNFIGWIADELPERSPILALVENGHAISVCFCARRSDVAAEAGVETTARFRGRGLAGIVTAAWASAIRASGLMPLYSTSWSNSASLAVARKLGLTMCASDWSVSG